MGKHSAGKAEREGHPDIPVSLMLDERTGKLIPYTTSNPHIDTSETMDYAALLRSFFSETIPNSEFWTSDDAARYFAELVTDVLNAQASNADHAKLAGLLHKVKSNEEAHEATGQIAAETPFTGIAHKIHEVNHKHGPAWGSWLAALVIPIALQLGGWPGQNAPSVPPPRPIPVTITYDNTHSAIPGGQSVTQKLTITGPPDITVISNILQQMSPVFNQLTRKQQYDLAHRVFVEMGKVRTQDGPVRSS